MKNHMCNGTVLGGVADTISRKMGKTLALDLLGISKPVSASNSNVLFNCGEAWGLILNLNFCLM
jgi:hypothetical protein